MIVLEFIINILSALISGILTVYIVRAIDKFINKNNRHKQ